jgi:uncharacterized protein (DUF1501 family)
MSNAPNGIASPLRRRLLRAAAATGLLAALDRQRALAQSAPDYKALVCVYLQGGNDGENTLVRYDTAGYQNYASIRPAASGLNIPQGSLLPIQPANVGVPYGLHPACATLRTLFDSGKLAVVANMGPLVVPVTRSTLNSAARPANLFSHSDQEFVVQSGDATGVSHAGWGGRVADRLDTYNQGSAFPPLISTNGLHTFASGLTSLPLTVPESAFFALSNSGDGNVSALREAAMRLILARTRSNIYEVAAQLYAEEGLSATSVVNPIAQNPNSVVAPAFANLTSGIANQLRTAARLIEGRQQTGLKRQVFYVHQIGYDTHGNQAGIQQQLLGDFSASVAAFYDAMKVLGLQDKVTVFTLSDFGRTFKPASNQGTDHGWGNYAFVIGGAVMGANFYGTVPTLAPNGPDDFSDAGRWIPTTSIEQYGATLCRWYGIAEGDLPYVFPNIGAFGNTNLGFMA